MKKYKKLFALILCLSLTAALLAGCGDKKDDSGMRDDFAGYDEEDEDGEYVYYDPNDSDDNEGTGDRDYLSRSTWYKDEYYFSFHQDGSVDFYNPETDTEEYGTYEISDGGEGIIHMDGYYLDIELDENELLVTNSEREHKYFGMVEYIPSKISPEKRKEIADKDKTPDIDSLKDTVWGDNYYELFFYKNGDFILDDIRNGNTLEGSYKAKGKTAGKVKAGDFEAEVKIEGSKLRVMEPDGDTYLDYLREAGNKKDHVKRYPLEHTRWSGMDFFYDFLPEGKIIVTSFKTGEAVSGEVKWSSDGEGRAKLENGEKIHFEMDDGMPILYESSQEYYALTRVYDYIPGDNGEEAPLASALAGEWVWTEDAVSFTFSDNGDCRYRDGTYDVTGSFTYDGTIINISIPDPETKTDVKYIGYLEGQKYLHLNDVPGHFAKK